MPSPSTDSGPGAIGKKRVANLCNTVQCWVCLFFFSSSFHRCLLWQIWFVLMKNAFASFYQCCQLRWIFFLYHWTTSFSNDMQDQNQNKTRRHVAFPGKLCDGRLQWVSDRVAKSVVCIVIWFSFMVGCPSRCTHSWGWSRAAPIQMLPHCHLQVAGMG